MNTGTFAGNIGRDAETKNVGQNIVTNFSVAVNTGFGDKKATLWVACALWGDRGPKLAQYLTSGTKVAVSGDIDVRAYAAKDGSPKAEMTCNVQRVTLQGSRGDGQRTSEDVARSDPPKAAALPDDDFNDPVPF